MCWPTRAENSDTDKAQSGESKKSDVDAQPIAKLARRQRGMSPRAAPTP